jgi:uncharacterized protein DUF2188
MANGDARVTYREDDEKWAVDVEGDAGAGSRHDRKARAERAARAEAREHGADLIVHDEAGRVQEHETPQTEPHE